MQLDARHHYLIRRYSTGPHDPTTPDFAVRDATRHLEARRDAGAGEWRVHLSTDGTRVIAIQALADVDATRLGVDDGDGDGDGDRVGDRHRDRDLACDRVYRIAGPLPRPLPIDELDGAVTMIDLFPVWRPLVGPVSRFNLRNGRQFDRHPGCLGTVVMTGLRGGIATYARWRTVDDFLDAFSVSTGTSVHTVADVNAWAARRTLGLLRPDYQECVVVAQSTEVTR